MWCFRSHETCLYMPLPRTRKVMFGMDLTGPTRPVDCILCASKPKLWQIEKQSTKLVGDIYIYIFGNELLLLHVGAR